MRQELLRAVAAMGVFVALIGGLALKRYFLPEAERAPVPAEYLGDEIIPPRNAPLFDLVDRSGERLRLEDLKDQVVLLSFAFTNCATVCPVAFQSYLGVQRQIEKNSIDDDVALVFITLDPDLDTPERLQEATLYVGGHWHFLTERQPILEQVWGAYGVFRQKSKGVVDHSMVAYLIDGQGLLRVRYAGTLQSSAILNDIDKLLAEHG